MTKQLGAVDQKWLHYVLHDKSGIEMAIELDENLIGVIGLVYPKGKNSCYVISNLAVNPKRRREGFGKLFLKQILEMFPLNSDEYWVAYINKSNKPVIKLFESCDWIKSEDVDKSMFKFVKQEI